MSSAKRTASEQSDTRAKKQTKLSFTSNNRKISGNSARPVGGPESRDTQSNKAEAHNKGEDSKRDAAAVAAEHFSHHDGQNALPQGFVKLHVVDLVGDLFEAPENTVLIHACNCIGSWGAGIAAAFKSKYPQAYKQHDKYCKRFEPKALVGTAQLIPPCEKQGNRHWIGCLFTSMRFGKRRDSPEEILKATRPAMEALLAQIQEQLEGNQKIEEIRMCRINSGLFAVPWEDSKRLLESIKVPEHEIRDIKAYSLS